MKFKSEPFGDPKEEPVTKSLPDGWCTQEE